MSSSQTQQIFPFHIKTNKTKRQNEADYTKQNPLRIDMFVNGLELTMDAEFQEKAVVLIFIDGTRRFDSTDEGNSLKGHLKYVIPLGLVLPRDKKIEVFVYNEIDSNFIECSFNLFLDEVLKSIPSESVPLDRNVFNKLVSESKELFAFKVYNSEVKTTLIDMKGYKKMIVTMSASTIPAITEEQTPDQSAQGTVEDVLYDFTQTISSTTLAVSGFEEIDSYDVTQIVDFGSTRNRDLTFSADKKTQTEIDSVGWHSAGTNSQADGNINSQKLYMDKTENYDVYESDDPTFVTGVTTLFTAINDIAQNLITTKRYLKIVEHVSITFSTGNIVISQQNNSGGSLPDITKNVAYNKVPTIFTNWLDTLSQGGQAALSFEISGAGNQWIELIAPSVFQTITQGQTIIKEIGDGFGFVLPSTQTNFRGKLTVTMGIETGVSVLLIA